MGSLEGKWAIVTGGNSGIGKETAAELAQRGAAVVIASRNTDLAAEAANEIKLLHPGARVEVAQLDLASQDSVRKFASGYKKSGRPLHILVANAGANFTSKRLTPEGAPLPCQVNYLGHYALTRLLEPVLIASKPSRVVSVSSVTHRFTSMPDPKAFLTQPAVSAYQETKLAQVLFTFEVQRRLGRFGVQASAVDPGGVRTNVWKGRFAKPPISWWVATFLAPARDGARAVVHAATADDSSEAAPKPHWVTQEDPRDLRFYAKGTYASPAITWYGGRTPGLLGAAVNYIFLLNALALSFLDWPVRNLTNGRLWGGVKRTTAMKQAYDRQTAKCLWEESAKMLKLPVEVQQPEQG